MSVTALNRRSVYNPRPTVLIDGQSNEMVNALLLSMDVRESEGGLTTLELRFNNVASDTEGGSDYAFENESVIRLGASITLNAGDFSDQQELFRGVITGLEADFPETNPPELVVLAEDKLQLARMSRRTKTWEDVSVSDVLNQIASDIGLQADVTGLNSGRGTWVQLNESDLAFARRLLTQFDADVQVVEDRLEVSPISEVQREVIEIEMFRDLRSVKFIADLSHQVTAITCAGWNPLRGQTVSGRGQGVNFGPGEGRYGSQVLQQTLGERVEHIGQIPVTTDEQAQAIADSAFDQRVRSFVRAQGTAAGHPSIRVGTHLRLTGVSQRFTNTYYVVGTHHRYDQNNGYLTDFTAESAALAEA